MQDVRGETNSIPPRDEVRSRLAGERMEIMSSHIQFGSGGSDWPGPGAPLYPSLLSSAMKLSHLRAGRFFFFFFKCEFEGAPG